eukprot:4025244-Amphidinium_carterae.1
MRWVELSLIQKLKPSRHRLPQIGIRTICKAHGPLEEKESAPHGPEAGDHVGSVTCQLCEGQGQNLVNGGGNICPKPLSGVEW